MYQIRFHGRGGQGNGGAGRAEAGGDAALRRGMGMVLGMG